jgi:hypothetical protein
MRKTTTVLSLGLEEWSNTLRDAVLPGKGYGFAGVNSYWNLCRLPEAVSADIAILHDSFPKHELRYAAEYIRRRWPTAIIFLMSHGEAVLDDPLYDDRADAGISPDTLVSMIEKSLARSRRSRLNRRRQLASYRSKRDGAICGSN